MADTKAGGPKYRLAEDHYISDQYLSAGTIIGDGTPFPYVSEDGQPVPPSRQMEPLNDAASAELKRIGVRADPVDSLEIKGAR